MDDKIIVTHKGALTAKYGAKGLAAIRKSLSTLVAADKKRGLKTAIVYLDDARTMKALHAKPLGDAPDFRSTKTAIDAVFKARKPDYVLILGAPDVIPHQDLKNPAYEAGDDDDAEAWGDLPYACDTAYERDPAKFVGPTRVVGRLPDLTGATEPSHLIALLKIAANWKSRKVEDYTGYFALSASVWQGSTRLSLDNIFGDDDRLLLAPPKGPKYSGGELGARMHFINCHGGPAAPEFYGQKAKQYPVSLNTKATAKTIHEGTVASVECCYGAELYDSVTLGIDMPICQSYLRQGAYGYLGSTTIAYGPAKTNGAADFLCQFFLLNVLGGASLGRAALMARQQFVEKSAQMDPIDLKTLAQFCLYGDPSIHPVVLAESVTAPKSADVEATARFRRNERRAKLKQTGDFLQETKPTASKREPGHRASANAKATLSNIAAKGGLPRAQPFEAFKFKCVKTTKSVTVKLASAPARYYLTIGTPKSSPKRELSRVAVVAKEVGGHIIDYCIYEQR